MAVALCRTDRTLLRGQYGSVKQGKNMRYAKGVGVRLTLRAIVLASLVGLCGCSSAARHNVASAISGAATAIARRPS